MRTLADIKKEFPELHEFIENNKNTRWLECEKYLSESDKSDLANVNHILQKRNADSAMMTDQFKLSLYEWNYIFKHNPAVVDLIISDMHDLKDGLQLLLNWSRELNLFKRRMHDIKVTDKSDLVMNLWKNGLFLQLFLVLCKDEHYRQLLLADDLSALTELVKLYHENPKLFNFVLHALSDKKFIDQALVDKGLNVHFSNSPTFKKLLLGQ